MPNQSTAFEQTGWSWGNQQVPLDAINCIAKEIDTETGPLYAVKVNMAGPDAGRFFDPTSVNFDQRIADKFLSERGVYQYEFKTVSQEVFALYLKFLETKNSSYVRNAERLHNV